MKIAAHAAFQSTSISYTSSKCVNDLPTASKCKSLCWAWHYCFT